MCWNQVENEKKKLRKRVGERKIKGGSGKWKVEKKKGERIGIYGYTCVVEKNQERKKTRSVWMIERKKGKIKFRNATTIFSQ